MAHLSTRFVARLRDLCCCRDAVGDGHGRPATAYGYHYGCAIMLAAFTNLTVVSTSSRKYLSNCSRPIIIGSTPIAASRSRTVDACTASMVSRWMRTTMSRGVFAGRNNPAQYTYVASGRPASVIVGT